MDLCEIFELGQRMELPLWLSIKLAKGNFVLVDIP
jgi:hypothetical protein